MRMVSQFGISRGLQQSCIDKTMKLIAVTLLLLTSSLAEGNTRNVRHRKLQEVVGETIPGQFIVELYPQYNPRGEATGLLKASQSGNSPNKAEITAYYDYAMYGFAMKNFPEEKLNGFMNNPQVKAVWRVSGELCV
jgi:hypothetical protein